MYRTGLSPGSVIVSCLFVDLCDLDPRLCHIHHRPPVVVTADRAYPVRQLHRPALLADGERATCQKVMGGASALPSTGVLFLWKRGHITGSPEGGEARCESRLPDNATQGTSIARLVCYDPVTSGSLGFQGFSGRVARRGEGRSCRFRIRTGLCCGCCHIRGRCRRNLYGTAAPGAFQKRGPA